LEIKIKFTIKAKQDLEESVKFYEDKKVGLGKDFLNTIKLKMQQIQSHPENNLTDKDGIKRAKIKVFPFYIYYIFKNSFVIIIAIWHIARIPFSKEERIQYIDE
jgi:plasmid stabilization system protein ParE